MMSNGSSRWSVSIFAQCSSFIDLGSVYQIAEILLGSPTRKFCRKQTKLVKLTLLELQLQKQCNFQWEAQYMLHVPASHTSLSFI